MGVGNSSAILGIRAGLEVMIVCRLGEMWGHPHAVVPAGV